MRLQPVKPSKRKNGYLVRLFDKDSSPAAQARIRVLDAKISVPSGSRNTANTEAIRVWIGPSNIAREFVLDCDSQALNLMIKHNKHWFQNSLTEEKIRDFFQDSFDAYGCITARLSESHPCKCSINGKTCSFNDAMENAAKYDATVVVIPAAIYVSSTAFHVLWYVEEIHVLDEVAEAEEADADVDRGEIESMWDTEVTAATAQLEDKMALLMKKHKYLETLKGQMVDFLEMAKSQPSANKLWGETLEKLGNKISGIKTGHLILEEAPRATAK